MKSSKLQIKKRVVYKPNNPTTSNSKTKYNEILDTSTIFPTMGTFVD